MKKILFSFTILICFLLFLEDIFSQESGGNLKSKIQLDELFTYINNKELTIEKKITYYEAFILDWPNTAAAKEAEIIIIDLKLENDEIELEKERTVYKGDYELEARSKAYMVDATTASKTFVHPDNPNIKVSFFVPIPTDFEKRFELDNYTKLEHGYYSGGQIFNYLQGKYYGVIEIKYGTIKKNIPVYGKDFNKLRFKKWEANNIDRFVVFSNFLEKIIEIDNLSIKIEIVTRSHIIDLSRFRDGRWYNLYVYKLKGSDLIVFVKEIKRIDI